jgi:hypothetical protein
LAEARRLVGCQSPALRRIDRRPRAEKSALNFRLKALSIDDTPVAFGCQVFPLDFSSNQGGRNSPKLVRIAPFRAS